MALVVGLHGPAGSGKDTVGDYLVNTCGWTKKLSYAANLKQMCRDIFFLSRFDVEEQAGKQALFTKPLTFTDRNLGSVMYWMSRTHGSYPLRKGSKEKVRSLVGTKLKNPRDVLQFVGTDICRELVPSYHLDIVNQQIKEEPSGKFVVTDVRFPNEGDLILDVFSGHVFLLERENIETKNINRKHPSESSMLDWGRFSGTINNYADDHENLYYNVNEALRKVNLCPDGTEIQTM